MENFEFLDTFHRLFNESALLFNEKVVMPTDLKGELPCAKEKLGFAHQQLIFTINNLSEATITEAAQKIFYTPQYTSRLADSLCKKGFIEKFKSKNDRASVSLRLSKSGRSLCKAETKMLHDYVKAKVSALDKDSRIKYLQCLEFNNGLFARLYDDQLYKPNKDAYPDLDSDGYYDRINKEITATSRLNNKIGSDPRHLGQNKKSASIADTNCMEVIFLNEPISMSSLAEKTRLSLATVSKAVTAFVEQGLVERFQKGDDRRVYYVRLTQTGRDIIVKEHSVFSDFLQEFFTTVQPEEREKLLGSIRFINRVMRSF